MKASEGKVFAYKDEEGNEVVLGSELYLGVNDDGSQYYEIDAPVENKEEEDTVIEEENTEETDEGEAE